MDKHQWERYFLYFCTYYKTKTVISMNTFKKCLPDILAVVLFVVIAAAYFFVPVSEGKVLHGNDATATVGAQREVNDYQNQTGKVSRWNNSIFSGMPTYQLAPSYDSMQPVNGIIKAYHLWLPDYIWYLFAYLLGFYILLRAFDFRQSLAALGSVIWAFSSYFLIIIAAGHMWKVMALAYLPPMIAGIVLAYRGKLLPGFIVTALFTAFEINANHVQMTYYYFFVILCMVIAFLAQAIKEKKMKRFWQATGVCIIAGLIGVAANASNLYHTYQYAKESMRGKSELVKKNTANQTSSGLDRDYITQWSYGIDETMTLLVPNAKGGASVPLSQNETAMAKQDYQVEQMLPQIYDGMPQYFGSQPGTSGPVYVGAFVLFLFILGLFIVKGPMKWALLAATILSILLSWGKNFMGLTNFFIDYVPMYAKFRTVASILVIAEFTIPLLAMMALKKIADDPKVLTRNMKFFWISLGLTAGVAVLVALMPGLMGPFIPEQESKMLNGIQGMTPDALNMITGSLATMRQAMVTSDAWRSVVIILIGAAVLLLFKAGKLKMPYMVGMLLVLCLVDMWQVDKRYLNDGMFVPKSEAAPTPAMSEADRMILQDKSKDYRVLNFASDTFNENQTAYYHHSIGGYHPAKLRRYQELIDQYIAPEMRATMQAIVNNNGNMAAVDGKKVYPVLNMLNTKYFILPLQSGATTALENPYALGNAWFVNKITYVGNANEEIDNVGKIDLRHEAVADKKFEAALKQSAENDSTAKVLLKSYAPDEIAYDVQSEKGGVVVFSEVYYPEWTATVDGKPAEVGRVDYVLRAVNVAPGSHKVVLTFHPKSVTTTEAIAYGALIIMLLAVVAGIVLAFRKPKEINKPED